MTSARERIAMRRRKLIATVVGLAVLTTAGVLWARHEQSEWVESQRIGRISRANYARIENGMSMEKVEGLLGSPGELTEYVPQVVNLTGTPLNIVRHVANVVSGDKLYLWEPEGATPRTHIFVGFTKSRVVSKYCLDDEGPQTP
jgi:hypothetical protein